MAGPLTGLLVVDLTEGIAGPYAARQFADYGADVFKIERPGGDPARQLGPFPGDAPHPEKSGLFATLNLNKRGAVLDLTDVADRSLFLALAARADAVIESFPPGTLERWGLAPDTLLAANPRLVVSRLTPFGQHGPAAGRAATDLTIAARSAWLISAGEPDREPLTYYGAQPSYLAALHAAWGTMAALLHAARTGRGQVVDTSMLEATIMVFDQQMVAATYWSGGGRLRTGRRAARFPPIVYPTADGYVSLLVTDLQWPRFCRMAGEPDLADDPSLATQAGRLARLEELEVTFLPWFLTRTKAEVFTIAQQHGVPIAPFLDVAEMLDDPHFRARNFFRTVTHPILGAMTIAGPPIIMTETPWAVYRPAPRLDEHAAEVRALAESPVRRGGIP